ncbi:MAG: helix-turn-helix domain-containing protein [Clostridiales bacterium]|jgi:hypothetical protein|nr:helix-turn-helix domain-containing protein [Eubacteriales bacterium]MDH7567164.1 helix-turn-helix domain-containing protein [Clostridiales bacterium]
MSVNISDVVSALEEYSPSVHLPFPCELSGFRYFEKDSKTYFPDCLYIAKISDLPLPPPPGLLSLLLWEDAPLPKEYAEALNTIMVKCTAESLSISNKVQDVFANEIKISNFIFRLLEASQAGKHIQQILDIGYEVLGNPLLLVDISLCFIAHAGGNTIENEPLWEWTLSKGYVTEEYVHSVMTGNGDFSTDGNSGTDIPIRWQSGLLNHRQIVGRVISDGIPLGYVKLLEYNRPITETDEKMLVILCRFISMSLKEHSSTFLPSTRPLIDSFLTALLNQKLYDHDAIDERVRRFNLKLYDNLCVLVVELGESGSLMDRVYYIKRKLQNAFNRDTVLFYGGNLVILYDSKNAELFTPGEMQSFRRILEDHGCRAGISQSFNSIYQLSEHYQQALTCLSLASKLKIEGTVLFYDDLCVLHMIHSFSEQTDITCLIHPMLRLLDEHDREKGSHFMDTLNAYLRHNQDIDEASKELHIHYNTLKYRIRRITEITGINFADSELLFRICLSYKVYDLLHRKEK